MIRFALFLEFQGAAFCGWQKQSEQAEANHLPSIQSVLEEAISILSRQSQIRVQGCGRTDAGVHALKYCCHFDLEQRPESLEKFRHGLNAILPAAIAALSFREVPSDFHALDSIQSKTYEYRLLLRRSKDVFFPDFQWTLPFDGLRQKNKFDIELLELASRDLVGEYDFAAFAAQGHGAKTTQRRIDKVQVDIASSRQQGCHVSLLFTGPGFLRHQVRNMVGTLVEIASHKKSPSHIKELLALGAGPSTNVQGLYCAPSHGLFLKELQYHVGN